jgi:MFS family permease
MRGFVAATCSLVAVFAASASPIPLYVLYSRSDALTHADLALTAVAYFVAVMGALLVLGRLSNHVGRRPVALAALGVTALGCLILTQVHSVAPLIAGRMLQGLGAGLASSALTAFIVDSAPVSPSWLASAVTTGAPMIGLTAGDRVFFEPGENHWHGAAPNRFMVHVAMHKNDDSGSPVTWGEHVTDEQYAAAPAS